jgi:hypothetical protein
MYEKDINNGEIISQIYLFLNNQRDVIRRKYMKIQDILALLGGLTKEYLLIFSSMTPN